MMLEGLIIKANSGFYYVSSGEKVFACHARGLFRRQKLTPLVGDRVNFSPDGDEGTVEEILPRKNSLVRPPVANLDLLCLVVSTAQPVPNLTVVDRLIVAAERGGIEPAVVVTKGDLGDGGAIVDVYKKAGIASFSASGLTGEGIGKLRELISGRVCAFTGNSGVGKSSLLNRLDPSLGLSTGEISIKLGRGRHTTRLVELFSTCGGFVADTPGFSAIDTGRFDPVLKDELQYAFREFGPYIDKCRFTGCSHVKEDGCAVLEAVKEGAIAASRHKSYCEMYEEAKAIKEWELKK